MSKNTKQSSQNVAHLAAKTLSDTNSSAIARRLAGSVVSQANTSKQTGSSLETTASKVLRSEKYSEDTKTLAASVLSQSNKSR